jgi:hypothetical protein
MIVSSEETRSSNPSRRFWLATAASLLIAVALSLVVSVLWQIQGWPFPYGVSVTFFLFASGILQPTQPAARRQSWRSRILLSLVLAIIIGGAYTLIVRS